MSDSQRWYDPIRQEFDSSFAEDWRLQLAKFNHHPAVKAAKKQFYLPREGHPPAWFNGNLPDLKPGEWVLVVSINPQINVAPLRFKTTTARLTHGGTTGERSIAYG